MPKKIQRRVPAPRARNEGPRPGIPGLADGKNKQHGAGLFGSKVSARALADFTTQFATLLEAGIPVVKSLRILEGQLRPGPLQRAVAQLAVDVEGGTPLSEAMEKEPKIFDQLYSNMIRAGEAGGIQDTILERLAAFMEKAEEIKARVKGALAYPAFVVIIGLVVIGAVLIFVIPTFKEIFEKQLRSDLPTITQLLVDASDFVVSHWYLWFLGGPALIALHMTLTRKVYGYRRWRDGLLLKLPVLGVLVKRTIVARFARTFGTLIQSGVPHVQGLEIVKASANNVVLQEGLDAISASIKEGEGIARPMGETQLFDDLVVNMVDVGEQTGELDRMLIRIAGRYEVQVDRAVDTVIKTMEIMIILFLALFVGLVVASLLAPMIQLMEQAGRR
ncbi:MAG: pilus assembly protein PilC [Planctomycetota bacterium]|nr:MAG: pilus assembly protein PilC [Planctomycetota bacterium]